MVINGKKISAVSPVMSTAAFAALVKLTSGGQSVPTGASGLDIADYFSPSRWHYCPVSGVLLLAICHY